MEKTKVTEEILKELEFTLKENKWVHTKGTYIYANNVPEYLVELVSIMTGTAFRKGQLKTTTHGNV